MINRIAIPSVDDRGLEALAASNYLECDFFTLVDVAEREFIRVTVISNDRDDNTPERVIKLLAENEVGIIILSNLDTKAYLQFMFANIEVLKGTPHKVVSLLESYQQNELKHFGDDRKCSNEHHQH